MGDYASSIRCDKIVARETSIIRTMGPRKAKPVPIRSRRLITGVVCSAAATAVALLISEAVVRSWTSLWASGYLPSENDSLVYELHPNYHIQSLKAQISPNG
jgi:hypothetical protein